MSRNNRLHIYTRFGTLLLHFCNNNVPKGENITCKDSKNRAALSATDPAKNR